MKEESQLEEMRAALRGDRERAEQARLRSQENVRALIEPTVESAVGDPPPAPLAGRAKVRRGLFRRR